MTQDEILKIIKEHPGILQKDLRSYSFLCSSKVSEQCSGLRRKGMIRREYAKGKMSFRLYVEEI